MSDVLFVSDMSGMSFWEIITWPINQLVKIVQWLFNGFKYYTITGICLASR